MAEETLHPRPAAAARILGECCVVVRGHACTFDGGVKWKVPSNARSLQTAKKGETYLQGRTHANKQKSKRPKPQAWHKPGPVLDKAPHARLLCAGSRARPVRRSSAGKRRYVQASRGMSREYEREKPEGGGRVRK
jgi:hypothetical protein